MSYHGITLAMLKANSLIIQLRYDLTPLTEEHSRLYNGLNVRQCVAYSAIINSVDSRIGGFYFVYGSAEMSKTYLTLTLTLFVLPHYGRYVSYFS